MLGIRALGVIGFKEKNSLLSEMSFSSTCLVWSGDRDSILKRE